MVNTRRRAHRRPDKNQTHRRTLPSVRSCRKKSPYGGHWSPSDVAKLVACLSPPDTTSDEESQGETEEELSVGEQLTASTAKASAKRHSTLSSSEESGSSDSDDEEPPPTKKKTTRSGKKRAKSQPKQAAKVPKELPKMTKTPTNNGKKKKSSSPEVISPADSAVSDALRTSKDIRRQQSVQDMPSSGKVAKLQAKIQTIKTKANEKINDANRDIIDLEKTNLGLNQQMATIAAEKARVEARLQEVEAMAFGSNGTKKKKKAGLCAAHVNGINISVKKLFRTTKFLSNDEQLRTFGDRVMDMMEMDELLHEPDETEDDAQKVEQARNVFFKKHEEVMTHALNEQRNYVQAEMKKVAMQYLRDNKDTNTDQKLWPSEDVEFALQRDLSEFEENDDDSDKEKGEKAAKLTYYHQILDFFVDKMVPTVAGYKLWPQEVCHFEPISFSQIPNSGGKLRITAGTEAFALLMYKNCKSKWEAMHKHDVIDKKKEKYPRYSKKQDPEKNLEWDTPYSDPTSGQNKFGGWRKKGKREYARLQKLVLAARGEKKRCREVDEATVARLFEENKDMHKKKNNSEGKKKRKAGEMEDDSSHDEDDFEIEEED